MSTSMPIRGRTLEAILSHHDLPIELFEGSTIYDLGCGKSDIGADLALRGIQAQVTGFDTHRAALDIGKAREGSAIRRYASLDALPIEDETADVVIGTYSLPYWANSSRQISAFFREASRGPRIGGILSIYPLKIFSDMLGEAEEAAPIRKAALDNEVKKIRLAGWEALTTNPDDTDILTVRKVTKYVH